MADNYREGTNITRLRADQAYEQRRTHIGHLPAQHLFDLARNEAAPKEWRKAAVELLMDGGHGQASHPELRELALEIRAEREAKSEVAALVEAAAEEKVFGEVQENNL